MLQIQRLRRGGLGRASRQRSAIFNRAEESGLLARGMKNRIHQEAGGGLAIGSRDSDQAEFAGGMSVKIRADNGQGFTGVGHREP